MSPQPTSRAVLGFSPSGPARSGAHLDVRGISFSYAHRRVFTDVSFQVSAGERVGLIGENGCGKSTLLKVIAGNLSPFAGEVTVNWTSSQSPRIGLLDQEPPFPRSLSVEGALEQSLTPVRRAMRDLEDFAEALADYPEDQALLKDYGRALDEVERLGAWEVEARVGIVLDGLGLGDLPKQRATGTLSGGERARLSLACLLLSAPDVLVLDEPTNHLDERTTSFLADVLVSWPGLVVMASHDRAFLDASATGLVDMDPAPRPRAMGDAGVGVTRFSGTYTEYRESRADVRRRWEAQFEDEQTELKRLRALAGKQVVGHEDWKPRTETKAAQKFYADRNARAVARRVNDAKSRLEKLEKAQVVRPPQALSFSGIPARAGAGPGPALVATNVAVDGRLAPVSICVGRGEKWLVTGPNGCGKSTLMGVLAGEVEPSAGTVTNHGVRVGVLSQDGCLDFGVGGGVGFHGAARPHGGVGPHVGLDSEAAFPACAPPSSSAAADRRFPTAGDVYRRAVGDGVAGRVPLGALGLVRTRDMNRPFRDLSVGTQRRVALAAVVADPPDVLILDEPTNHFSLSLVEELEAAIETYEGALIVVSHDRWLRERWMGLRLTMG